MGHKISKEQIDPGVKDHIMSFVGDVNELETDEKLNIIDAVNSLIVDRVDNAENMGKLANAIGEPITANHSVNEVVEGLGEMLSTFKTNMMNNGVVVESGDKFKQLIDKLTILSDSEGSGIQFSTGFINKTSLAGESNTNWVRNPMTFDTPLPFTPTRVIVSLPDVGMNTDISGNYYIGNISVDSLLCFDDNVSDELSMYDVHGDRVYLYITNITNNGFDLYARKTSSNNPLGTPSGLYWCAIGVGEEDTTLRDSLADILENKGVDVTEEDDMASLITKVDSIESGGLDIISATELPESGRENQLCVITNNPVSNFKITTDVTSTYDCPNDTIILYSGEAHEGVQLYEYINGVITFNYYFTKTQQGKNGLYLYHYNNGAWNNLTQGYMPFVENGVLVNTDYFGGIPSGSWKIANNALYLSSPGVRYTFITTVNKIDFSLFNTVEITARIAGGEYGISSEALDLSVFYWTSPLNNVEQYSNLLNEIKTVSSDISKKYTFSEESVTKTIDISSWAGDYYFGIYWYTPYPHKCYITNITFK